MPVDIKFEGMDELLRKVEELGKKGSRIENTALKTAGEYLAEEMKKEAPVRTGELRDSIKASNAKTKQGQKYVEVGPDETTNWRAKFIEFGTVKMKANPFMSRAYEKNKDKIQEIIAQKLKEGLGL
ncbi:HK97-gp10 family putative phage morphogenesis protein [Caldanaerobius polysaccharolyticus]|uniref:HK97-gp10 family putative phage morphogenesis protein n=1 Tax=Caldanaerobius polysaccharolyticus TaxID=44256 RepID=UPI000479A439|nr:HK97-gp10 family putative phage morphogenesis protein [Caldanaerobius polysaccharolyticus]